MGRRPEPRAEGNPAMRTRSPFAILVVLLASAGTTAGRAAAGPLWDQSDVGLTSAYDISGFVPAADFTIGAATLATGVELWMTDGDYRDDGTLNRFDGVLGWAIYGDGGGKPGALVARGVASGLVESDTGIQAIFGDIFRARFELDQAVELTAGTYWLALHEGTWGSSYDLSQVYWVVSSSVHGNGVFYATDETNPGSWLAGVAGDDLAFVVEGSVAAWSQPAIAGGGGGDISDSAAANDFVVAGTAGFSAIDVWLTESLAPSDDGVLEGFDGTLGWAIYDDDGGKPGTLVASGEDAAPELADSGLQSASDADVVRARLRLGSRITLDAGTYWLALHEGAWGSPPDGTPVYWASTLTPSGNPEWSDASPQAPSSWAAGPAGDGAFVLFEQPLFASGFERGVTCAWTRGGLCP